MVLASYWCAIPRQETTSVKNNRINGSHNLKGILLTHQPNNGCADRTNSILNDASFLMHREFL